MDGITDGTPLFFGAYPLAWGIEVVDDSKHRGFDADSGWNRTLFDPFRRFIDPCMRAVLGNHKVCLGSGLRPRKKKYGTKVQDYQAPWSNNRHPCHLGVFQARDLVHFPADLETIESAFTFSQVWSEAVVSPSPYDGHI